jgi:integrase
VFAKPDGRPLNPNTDYHEWKALLSEAGVHDGRLHDARHTAATSSILAVPTPTAMAIMGWSSAAMATRYQHVLDSILKGVAGQVGGLLWDAPESDPAAADDDDGEGTAGVLAPA